MINRISHLCSCVIEFIKLVGEKDKMRGKNPRILSYSPTSLINSRTMSTHVSKILYVSHIINRHVLTSTNPCLNNTIHALLIHGFAILRISIPGPSQNLTSSSLISNVCNRQRSFVTSKWKLSFALEAAFSKH